MLLVSLLLAAWLDIDLWSLLQWDPLALVWGFGFALPLCGLSLAVQYCPWKSCDRIREIWHTSMGAALASCYWWDLALLAVMVGISEELLFRGVLQGWASQYGWIVAVVLTNVIFGLAHSMTATYAVLAGLIGVYLSLAMCATGTPSLVPPIVAHSVCDFFAFLLIQREFARRPRSDEAI